MDKVFELSTRERFDALLLRKDDLSKSNTYYHRICPTDAKEVDAKLAEAAAAAAAKKKAAAEKTAAAPATGSTSATGAAPAGPTPPTAPV